MSELTDLEICTRITEIEFGETSEDWFISDGIVSVLNECTGKLLNGYSEYNPLTDDALCFQLMVKYGVRYEGRKSNGLHRFWIDNIRNKKHITNKNQNKAICLAIIEAKKDK